MDTFGPSKSEVPEMETVSPEDVSTNWPPLPSIPSFITDPLDGFANIADAVGSIVADTGRNIYQEGAEEFVEFGEWVIKKEKIE